MSATLLPPGTDLRDCHIGGGEGSLNFEVFEFTPSILLENALLASRKNITFIIHLLLPHLLKHICFTV